MRVAHSASSVKTGMRCMRRWAYEYIDGIRSPETASTALGHAVHRLAEAHYRGQTVDWTTREGEILASGIGLAPVRDECLSIEVEGPIGSTPIEGARAPVAMVVDGIAWVGYRDLMCTTADGVIQIDWKTTTSIAKYAMTPDALAMDLQACLYSMDMCLRMRDDSPARGRWIYMETGASRRAKAVDCVIEYDGAKRVVMDACEIARALDALTSSEVAPGNPDACYDYGGCPHHRSNGGSCDVRRKISAGLKRGKKENMSIAAMKAKFAATTTPPPPQATTQASPPEGQPSLIADTEPAPPPPAPQATMQASTPEGQPSLIADTEPAPAPEATTSYRIQRASGERERVRRLVRAYDALEIAESEYAAALAALAGAS